MTGAARIIWKAMRPLDTSSVDEKLARLDRCTRKTDAQVRLLGMGISRAAPQQIAEFGSSMADHFGNLMRATFGMKVADQTAAECQELLNRIK